LPATSPSAVQEGTPPENSDLGCKPLDFERIPRAAWDRLYTETYGATPFSRWTFHRAWWDAYGTTAHEQYLLCLDDEQIRAIVPLMHRHEEEPQDERTATVLRHRTLMGTRVRPDAKAVFFGASYHADYATLLCPPAELPRTALAVVEALAGPPDTDHGDQPWDVVDLRRLRSGDPALPALEDAFCATATGSGWQVVREREDVCPVISVASGAGFEVYLTSLGKKARHEIRRKLRRAQAAGPLSVEISEPTAQVVDTFIELHQKRFGDDGLFPDTEGGQRSRHFVHRLAELELAEGEGRQLHVAQVRSADRLIFAALAFDDGQTCYLYNAGMDPHAAELSPGISGTAEYLRDRIEAGRTRFDFMRGNEPYKYEWGARDETIERLLVMREAAA
jgi:hypothetical protein